MAIHYRTQGIIIAKNERGESDQILTVFTKDFGKLEIIAKAIRKITSKLRAGAEIFCLSEIEFIQGKAYKTLTDAFVPEKFKDIKTNLEKLKIASSIGNVLDGLIKGEEKDEKIWDLLNEVFSSLNLWQAKLEILYYYFIWRVFLILGYQSDLYHCCVCSRKLSPAKLYFNFKEKGIIDGACFKKTEENQEISAEIIKILRLFEKGDAGPLKKLKIEQAHLESLELFFQNYLAHFTQAV